MGVKRAQRKEKGLRLNQRNKTDEINKINKNDRISKYGVHVKIKEDSITQQEIEAHTEEEKKSLSCRMKNKTKRRYNM